jgi:hypothetical protein
VAVVVVVGVAPVPVVLLVPAVGFAELAILLVVLLEVTPVGAVLILIPGMSVLVGSVFVTVFLPITIVIIAILGYGREGQRKRRGGNHYRNVSMHSSSWWV